MPFYLFVWNDDNEEHLAEHGVTSSAKLSAIPSDWRSVNHLVDPLPLGIQRRVSTWRVSTNY